MGISPFSSPRQPFSYSITHRLDRVLDAAITQNRIVGATVLVAHRGKEIYRGSAGYFDREARLPMRDNTIFIMGSLSKPLVSVIAMRMVEKGLISLSDPLTRWLPDFRPKLANGTEPVIRIWHLLTHTSGLAYRFVEPQDSPYHRLSIPDTLDEVGMTIQESLQRLASAPLFSVPGKKWRYSLSIDVLGALLEAVCQQKLGDIVKNWLAGPLGMADTGCGVTDTSRFAITYHDGQNRPVRMNMNKNTQLPLFGSSVVLNPNRTVHPDAYASAGICLVSTADDMMLFTESLRRGGMPLLKRQSFELMLRDHVGSQAQSQGPGWGFGMGWGVLNDPLCTYTPQSAGTIQWRGVYGHYWFMDRQNQLSAVVMTNTAFRGMIGCFPRNIRDAIYGVENKGEYREGIWDGYQ
ncbi:serine hydrolase domain-containing protein [Yersinia nurmii]|uniref:Beta-lactamase class C and other penicillin binding proteins n=1 Tax=Yersinia nurmii TaxID=685706 RepID=A0AAW7K1U4_9GAMM|nr:serine hydrolase domain-containing protein [Yersinia nurmii]MDN0087437.1 serine hydrolase domain-containing protein [Yersinia nurmii]CNE59799.1 beta-lactamase class C and other penicillin binding proteins [Yersinia nurmii]